MNPFVFRETGRRASSPEELLAGIKKLTPSQAQAYVIRGEFSSWAENELGNRSLAVVLKTAKNKADLVRYLEAKARNKLTAAEKKRMHDELLAPGHKACAGCGPAIVMRHMLQAAGSNIVICHATGCMEVVSSQYPLTSWRVPWIHVTFENAASVASGVREALAAQGRDDVKVIAFGGDGGIVDIGFRGLSGALERGSDVLVICYDNEAYMNTGIQRSGATPWHASTTTTPAGKYSKGKEQWKKDMPSIAAAHGIPYVATASVAFPEDFRRKVKKALSIKGPKYIHIHAPCTLGWRYDPSLTIKVAKAAVESKMWALYEIENSEKKLSHEPKGTPVKDYLRMQGRFKHLTGKDLEEYQKRVDEAWQSGKL